ncbi:hypothetical protein MMC21_003120 [Puttea exsequens]|nr:hypothetical protein [Puttea exsequens]
MVLAHTFQRRQDSPSSDSPSPPNSPYLSAATYFTPSDYNKADFANSAPSILDLNNFSFPTSDDSYYLDTRQSTPSDRFNYGLADSAQLMQNASHHYPQVRVLQTPNHRNHSSVDTPPPMLEEKELTQPLWNSAFLEPSYLTPTNQQYNPNSYRTHKRVSSDSSVGSGGPDSPFTQYSTYPQIVDSETHPEQAAHFDTLDGAFAQYPKTHHLASESINQSYYPAFENIDIQHNNAAMMSGQPTGYRMGQQRAQNTSNAVGGQMDGSASMRNPASLDRTMSDIYQDELYNPAMTSTPSSAKRPSQGTHFSAQQQNRALSEVLKTATNSHLSARAASPITNNMSRNKSPFRDSSKFATEQFSQTNPSSPAPTRLDSAAHQRESRKMQADAQALADHLPQRNDHLSPPKTISPKEVALDYTDNDTDSKIDLFPKSEPQAASYQNNNIQNLGSVRRLSSNYSSATPQQPGTFSFMTPSLPVQQSSMPLSPYPFITHASRQSSLRSTSDQVPEFPATLTSMESTKSDSAQGENVRIMPEASQPSSQESVQRPSDTSANSGTYTCTGCNARFETAIKLQKHRRESHRASPYSAASPTTPSASTPQAGANSTSRNTQLGPHRCEKINPNTGKPCNAVFSRSYDLTRHEDTIHSSRKHKVRCHLCTEDKTFSRNDALTRHMRVVHPDVDFPGKTRRARNSDGADLVKQGLEGRRR